MSDIVRIVAVWAIAALVTACSAAGVLATDDPSQKLNDAVFLFDDQGRPLRAEPLIVEAMNQYKASGDALGLANSYRVYGLFFRSRSLGQNGYPGHYREKGFIDPVATYDTRYDRSLYYFALAAGIYQSAGREDYLSNVYFHMGDVYVLKGDKVTACQYYDKSLAANSESRASHPGSEVEGAGAKTYEQRVAGAKQYAGCPPTA